MDILQRLRTATTAAHQRLEDRLDLLARPFEHARFAEVLQGFWGFHAVWEPAVERHCVFHGLTQGRSRLAALSADLRALGLEPRGGQCAAAAGLAVSEAETLGSLYVMEGSTLGGRVIARALGDAPWMPVEGLRYFDPYGDRAGGMWRTFQAAFRTAAVGRPAEAIEHGATATFDLLADWLTPAKVAA